MSLTLSQGLLGRLDEEGKRLYTQNEHYKNLLHVMEDPSFRYFYERYFNDPEMLRVILSFMHVYEQVEKQGPNHLSPLQKIAILKRVFDEGPLRRRALLSTPTIKET